MRHNESIRNAVGSFWQQRATQAAKQRDFGKQDQGFRGAVTGGGHLNGIRDLLVDHFTRNGIRSDAIHVDRGLVLPGYYRPTKKWDLVVMEDDQLLAAIELKSQVGPSFGNNFNNRSEEAIGVAVDVRKSFEAGTLGTLEPWLGYVFLLEDTTKSTSRIRIDETLFPTDSVFHETSYMQRYGTLFQRLVTSGLYDAIWFVTSTDQGEVQEPVSDLSFEMFSISIERRIASIRNS